MSRTTDHLERLGPAAQMLAATTSNAILQALAPVLEVVPSEDDPTPEGVTLRLAVEEVLADVSTILAAGHPEMVPEVLARFQTSKGRVRVRAVSGARETVSAVILTGAGIVAQMVTGGLNRTVGAALVALGEVAAAMAPPAEESEEGSPQ